MRLAECTAAWSADAVITHSTTEAALLAQSVPDAHVVHVPWEIAPHASTVKFARRQGVAFIGNYAHGPNEDAARWLVEAVMPLVWQIDPTIPCRLVGSEMTEIVRRLAQPGVEIVGSVADLNAEVLAHTRLTVAPLRFGAGVKVKVLESFAFGVPCVMSALAADGLPLPPALQALVADDAEGLAQHICRLHAVEAAHRAAVKAGLALVREWGAADAVVSGLQAAIEGRQVTALVASR
jgi:glycosyltransferase involved in cell wall biosynthesis